MSNGGFGGIHEQSCLIVYLHGFNSSPQSHKAQVMQRFMAERGLRARVRLPGLPPLAGDAIARDRERCRLEDGRCFIGSSLGGFYATYLAEKHGAEGGADQSGDRPARRPARLSRPAEEPAYRRALRAHRGAPARSGRSSTCRASRRSATCCIVETGDEVLDYRKAVARYAGARAGRDPGRRPQPAELPAASAAHTRVLPCTFSMRKTAS